MRIATMALLAVVTAACGGSLPPPQDELSAAQAEVARAEGGGASSDSVGDAKLHLQLAREDLQKAHALFDQDNRRAADLIAVARSEAQLALSLAKEKSAEDQARRAEQDLAKAKGGQ